jgi:hypothetical protein
MWLQFRRFWRFRPEKNANEKIGERENKKRLAVQATVIGDSLGNAGKMPGVRDSRGLVKRALIEF